jgi:hypothetical protein
VFFRHSVKCCLCVQYEYVGLHGCALATFLEPRPPTRQCMGCFRACLPSLSSSFSVVTDRRLSDSGKLVVKLTRMPPSPFTAQTSCMRSHIWSRALHLSPCAGHGVRLRRRRRQCRCRRHSGDLFHARQSRNQRGLGPRLCPKPYTLGTNGLPPPLALACSISLEHHPPPPALLAPRSVLLPQLIRSGRLWSPIQLFSCSQSGSAADRQSRALVPFHPVVLPLVCLPSGPTAPCRPSVGLSTFWLVASLQLVCRLVFLVPGGHLSDKLTAAACPA